MATKLKDLKINRVDLVDAGANPEAHIMLYKRKGAESMDFEALLKSLPEDQQKLINDQIEKSKTDAVAAEVAKKDEKIADLEQDVTKKDTELKEANDKLAEFAKSKEEERFKAEAEKLGEEVLKSVDPVVKAAIEAVKKQAEEASKRAEVAEGIVKSLEDEKINKQYLDIAKSFDKLPIEAEKVGPILKNMAKANPDDYKVVEGLLKAANEAVAKGNLFAEMGKGNGNGEGAESAWQEMEKKASELVTKSTTGLTKEQAIVQIARQEPDLYKRYVEEMNKSEEEVE